MDTITQISKSGFCAKCSVFCALIKRQESKKKWRSCSVYNAFLFTCIAQYLELLFSWSEGGVLCFELIQGCTKLCNILQSCAKLCTWIARHLELLDAILCFKLIQGCAKLYTMLMYIVHALQSIWSC